MGKYSCDDATPLSPYSPCSHYNNAVPSSSLSRCCGGGWDSVGEGLLDLILDKLLSNSVYDYIRCATVCKSWLHSAQLQHDERYRRMKKKQLPLLLIPTATVVDCSKTYQSRRLYNIISNNTKSSLLKSVSWEDGKRSCCGSSHGWLIFADQETIIALTLYNPFTGATIYLPPLLTKKQLDDQYYFYHYKIKKVVLSEDPSSSSNPSNYQVLALQSNGRLALFTSTDGTWIYTENYFEPYPLMSCSKHDDIIYSNGKFHALIDRNLGSIIKIYKKDDKPATSYIRLEPLGGVDETDILWGHSYLAQSIHGTLLYIERYLNGVIYLPFRVYELEELEEAADRTKRFTRTLLQEGGVRGLGDQALFLTYNHSASVRASDFPGRKPNSIYFTPDKFGGPPYQGLGVYTLGDEHVNPLYMFDHPLHTHHHLPPPIWIEPTPNLMSSLEKDA